MQPAEDQSHTLDLQAPSMRTSKTAFEGAYAADARAQGVAVAENAALRSRFLRPAAHLMSLWAPPPSEAFLE